MVQFLLNHKDIDVNKATKDRLTPLMASAEGGHNKIVKALLSHQRINTNFANYDGKTALFLSIPSYYKVDQGSLKDMLELLLKCPTVDIDHKDENGYRAPYYADAYANATGFSNLTDLFESSYHADLKKSGHTCCSDQVNYGLQKAVEEGDLYMVKAFLQCYLVDLNHGYKYDMTPLYVASSNPGGSKLVEVFLNDPRVDVNIEVNSATALYTSAENGNKKVLELLLSHYDIDVNKVNRRNRMSVLMIAVEKGQAEIVRLLLDNSQTDVNIIDARDQSALSIASKRQSMRLVKLILRCPKVHVNNILQKEHYYSQNIIEVLN